MDGRLENGFLLLVLAVIFPHVFGRSIIQGIASLSVLRLLLPPTLLVLGMFLRLIQNESWKWVRYQQNKFNARYHYRQLS